MTILERLDADLVTALKAHEAENVSILRMLKSAVKNSQISLGHNLDDSEVLAILEKQVKQRQDAAIQYEKGGRNDIADKEKAEADFISTYLPPKMDKEALILLVESKIRELGANSIKDMGAVMKSVATEAAGAVDGKTLSEVVKAKLS